MGHFLADQTQSNPSNMKCNHKWPTPVEISRPQPNHKAISAVKSYFQTPFYSKHSISLAASKRLSLNITRQTCKNRGSNSYNLQSLTGLTKSYKLLKKPRLSLDYSSHIASLILHIYYILPQEKPHKIPNIIKKARKAAAAYRERDTVKIP